MERAFKGVWIPKEIWLSEDLGWTEKFLLTEIDSLSKNGECFATNEYFANFFNLSKDRISKLISELSNKGYVEVSLIYKPGTKQVEKRVITTIGYRRKQLGGIGENNYTPPGENNYYINSSFINTNINNNNDDDNAFNFFQSNGFGIINPFISEKIGNWIDDTSDELVVEAMKRALLQNKKNWSYVEAILRSWLNQNVKTLNDVEALDKSREQNKPKSKPRNKNIHEAPTPSWMNETSNPDNEDDTKDLSWIKDF